MGGVDTWSNPANGLSVTAHFAGPLLRRNVEEHFTIDAAGRETGYFTSTDSYSGNDVATAPSWGAVVLSAGHLVAFHTSYFVDGARVRRVDDVVFNAGPTYELTRLCEYLQG